MITEQNLPREIKKIALRYKQDKDIMDVFLVKVIVNEIGHYVIRYLPSKASLVIREDGEVLPFDQAVNLVLISFTLDKTADLLQNGLRWKRDQRVFIGIKNTVKHFMKKYQKDAPAQVENAMKMFVELPDQIMEHQHKIEESVLEGIKYMKNMGYRGIVTEDDMNQIKKIRNEMLYHIYWQCEVQLRTEGDREKVLKYLDTKIPLWNIFDKPIYWYLKLQNRNLLSRKRYPNEVREMERIKKIVFDDAPLIDTKDARRILDGCRNPK